MICWLCRSPLERCRAPGAGRMQLPFVCPLDQILRPSHFGDAPELYGPPIAFREHSFWDNPDTPAELKVTGNFYLRTAGVPACFSPGNSHALWQASNPSHLNEGLLHSLDVLEPSCTCNTGKHLQHMEQRKSCSTCKHRHPSIAVVGRRITRWRWYQWQRRRGALPRG